MSDEELEHALMDLFCKTEQFALEFLGAKTSKEDFANNNAVGRTLDHQQAAHIAMQLIKQHREAYASEKEAKLLNALGGMYGQYCAKPHGHDFMGAGEEAIEILEDYGIHDESRQWDEQSYDKLEKKVAELREKVGKL
jgi:hypothetical protein